MLLICQAQEGGRSRNKVNEQETKKEKEERESAVRIEEDREDDGE